jgi:ribose 5-phosphate isomerase A
LFNQIDLEKRNAALAATEFIHNGMTIGLGSGTTVYWMIEILGNLIKNGLEITGVPTSRKTEEWARKFAIPLISLAKVDEIHLTIDGANEVDGNLNLIKGGGGSLVREKIVGHFSHENIIIINQAKIHPELGSFPLPVEVVPFGWELTSKYIQRLGGRVVLRKKHHQIFVTDNGNYILDCQFGSLKNPGALHHELKLLPGVVETGLFVDLTDKLIIGKNDSVEIMENIIK